MYRIGRLRISFFSIYHHVQV